MSDVTLRECIRWNLFEVLNEKYAAAFCSSMRFHYESFFPVCCHVPFARFSLFLQLKGHWNEIEIMLEMPLHPLENSGELGFVGGDACSGQTIEDSSSTHDPLIV